MTRADRRLCRQIAYMIGGGLLLMYLMGAVMLWLVPPSDLERECVGKRPVELLQCLQEKGPPVRQIGSP